jgi:PPOX class probable F420-dependent enzyme
MGVIPDNCLHLLTTKKAFANIATVMKDGSAQVTPIWFDYADGKIRVNTARGRVKARTLCPGARVALAISDPDNPYRYLQVPSRVLNVTDEGADTHIDSLAKKYLGQDRYPFRQPGEVRMRCEIEPTSAQAMG